MTVDRMSAGLGALSVGTQLRAVGGALVLGRFLFVCKRACPEGLSFLSARVQGSMTSPGGRHLQEEAGAALAVASFWGHGAWDLLPRHVCHQTCLSTLVESRSVCFSILGNPCQEAPERWPQRGQCLAGHLFSRVTAVWVLCHSAEAGVHGTPVGETAGCHQDGRWGGCGSPPQLLPCCVPGSGPDGDE